MEIIAKRKKSAAKIFIACIVVGVLCSVVLPTYIVVMYCIGQAGLDALIACGTTVLIVGLVFLITGIVMERKMRKLPKRIVREGNNIDFGNGLVCTADKIENVTYSQYTSRRLMHKFSYGRLTVCVDGTVLEYEFIDNVEQASERLLQLMREATNKQ